MLPNNAISAVATYAAYLEPDASDTLETESLEQGGTAINDASNGRQVQTWRAWVDGTAIKVSPISGTPVTTLLSGLGTVTSVSLAFDSSMAPTISYIEDGTVKLRWYNSQTEAFQIDSFADATSARVCTDDKRSSQEGPSDVIFAYVKDDVLYWRQQRDRFLTERTVGDAVGLKLTRLGLNAKNRLQFELNEA